MPAPPSVVQRVPRLLQQLIHVEWSPSRARLLRGPEKVRKEVPLQPLGDFPPQQAELRARAPAKWPALLQTLLLEPVVDVGGFADCCVVV